MSGKIIYLPDEKGELAAGFSARLQTLHDVRPVKSTARGKAHLLFAFDTHVPRLVETAIEHAAETP